MPGAMSGGGGNGPRARAAATSSANCLAASGGTLRIQADSISRMRSDSAARRTRSGRECFVMGASFETADGPALTLRV